MSPQPIGYVIEYEITALLFLLVIMWRYFSMRRFPNQKTRLFAVILWLTVADLALDVVSSVFIDNVFAYPAVAVYLINGIFYCLQLLLPLLMAVYTSAMTGYLDRRRLLRLSPLFLPGGAMILLLAGNPFTHLFFRIDPAEGYVHGPAFLFCYIACLFYMVVTFVIAFRSRAALRRIEYLTICRFLVIVLAAMAVQYFYPPLLLSGVAIALAVILMYFTLQNPDTMLDATTEAFTYEAMLAFLRDRMEERARIQLVAVKIRNMSRINELLGAENGSVLLRQVRVFLSGSARDVWVFRMRGSCFVAITRRAADYAALCGRCDARIGEPWNINGVEIVLQTTVCCVDTETLRGKSISPAEAVNYLDTAFLQGEHTVGRRLTIGPDLLDSIARARAVEAALRAALTDGGGLELFYQPLWSTRDRRFTRAEVLLRLTDPVLGRVPPDEFVPVAERCGLITALDEFVVRRACAFVRDSDLCRALGLESLEINLSALEFMHRRLPELLRDIMAEFGVDPSFLCFEITETAATESFELLRACMTALCGVGCAFALDDFGTGYANISQVIRLPFQTVKLDRSLLYGPGVVLEDMARMFARMDRRTVVEGVETAEQAALMQTYPIDYIQGYFYARPMDGPAFLQLLRAQA